MIGLVCSICGTSAGAVHPTQLAFLAIETDPVRVTWIGGHRPPRELLTNRLVYLGKANGVVALYQPPDWSSCPVHDCRGAVWKVNESDVLLCLEVNPPDRHAPKPSHTARHGRLSASTLRTHLGPVPVLMTSLLMSCYGLSSISGVTSRA